MYTRVSITRSRTVAATRNRNVFQDVFGHLREVEFRVRDPDTPSSSRGKQKKSKRGRTIGGGPLRLDAVITAGGSGTTTVSVDAEPEKNDTCIGVDTCPNCGNIDHDKSACSLNVPSGNILPPITCLQCKRSYTYIDQMLHTETRLCSAHQIGNSKLKIAQSTIARIEEIVATGITEEDALKWMGISATRYEKLKERLN